MIMIFRVVFYFLVFIISNGFIFPIESPGVTFKKGDIIIADFNGSSAGSIFKVDPITGTQTTVSTGGSFVDPYHVRVDADGFLVVVDRSAFDGNGGVIRLNTDSGSQTTISSGGSFVDPRGLAIDSDGDIIVVDQNAFGGAGGLIRVDPNTGSQTTISSGGSFREPAGVTIDSNGNFIVADLDAFTSSKGGIIEVTPGGAQTKIDSGGNFKDPEDVTIDSIGDYISVDSGFGADGALFRTHINPDTTITRTKISSGGFFEDPSSIAIDFSGNFIVADRNAFEGSVGGIIQVTPAGVQSIISSGGLFIDPQGIAIYPYDFSLGNNVEMAFSGVKVTIDTVTDAGDLIVTASAISDDTFRANIPELFLIDPDSKKSITASGLSFTGNLDIELEFAPQGGYDPFVHFAFARHSDGSYEVFDTTVVLEGGVYKAIFQSATLSDFAVGVQPEPATLLLLGLAFLGLFPLRRKLF